MQAAHQYHRLALDCLELAEAARDPSVRDHMIRLAELWASMADRAISEQERRVA
jgi:hypothetical protein